jgi:hypothetical protein
MELTRGLLQLCAAVAFTGRTATLGAQKRLLWQEVLPTQCVSRELSTLEVPDVESKNQKRSAVSTYKVLYVSSMLFKLVWALSSGASITALHQISNMH